MDRTIRLVILTIATGLIGGCATQNIYVPQSGDKMQIRQHTMDFFTTSYLPAIGSTRPGAFAVSKSGDASGYSWCDETACSSGSSYSTHAINDCQSAGGDSCYIFAYGRDIKVDYIVIP
jgi:hypothetical protein